MGGQIGAEENLLAQTASINEEKNDNGKAQSESGQLNSIKQKLKRYHQSQDKLAPLFGDPEQSIDTCYIRLALLTQQQFQQQKDKMINNQKKKEKIKNMMVIKKKMENGQIHWIIH
ncbi:hypothetical protein RFI_32628 [Reticulomyxa filosa]|uniref:Uncharacterized protein n=1 Tax=Reticulomyxa filosa TaxID=46433 RepID=X6LS99_RETFI|nr:hypothetical protein RFI_32628 [Reticulomyxa filosa]|eukprot:ETO04768.1 hypothetical protein RFI_32628 [Reticulomyxa filosa]